MTVCSSISPQKSKEKTRLNHSARCACVAAMAKWRFLGACLLVAVWLLQAAVLGHGEEEEKGRLLDPGELEKFVDELPDMPVLRGYGVAEDGKLVAGNLTVGMYDTMWKFHRDLPATRVFAYGASKETATVPGPTIMAMQGVPTRVTWTNHLPARHFLPWDRTLATARPGTGGGVPTVVHLHGGVQQSTSDGHSLAWFTSGFASTGPHFSSPAYEYPNQQPPGNLWYHDHAMGLTRVNILAGLLGAYRVASPAAEGPLNLPSGAAFDRNLVLFDRDLRTDGSLFMNATGNNPGVHPQWQPEYFGAVVVANGKAWPFLSVRRRRYRFRILNASNARFFRLSLSGGLRFVHVASDSVYLARPVATGEFVLAPSEIADVVVDFAESSTGTDTAILRSDAPAPYPGDPGEKAETVPVMKFLIGRSPDHDPSTVPAALMPEYPKADAREVVLTRHITMYEYTKNGTDEPTHLYLNARSYMDPVTETPREGTSEVWEVVNLTDDNHPLHLHLAVFTVLEQRSLRRVDELRDCMRGSASGGSGGRNDARACGLQRHLAGGRRHVVPRQERGWKNVFKVRPSAVTRLLVRFKPLTAPSTAAAESRFPFDVTAGPGYVYHCHILDHEDNEMMRPMKIVR